MKTKFKRTSLFVLMLVVAFIGLAIVNDEMFNVDTAQATTIEVDGEIVQVEAGDFGSYILTNQGTVYSFGDNYMKQLGLGIDEDSIDTPTAIPAASFNNEKVVQISSGSEFVLALTESGTVYGFGANATGQLGLGDTTDRGTPTKIPETSFDNKTVVEISVGSTHSMALTKDGAVYTFGDNSGGQLGLGDTTERSTPTKISATTFDDKKPIKAISGRDFSLVLVEDGTLYVFGNNSPAKLGLGSDEANEITIPTAINSSAFENKTIKKVVANNHVLVLTEDGTIFSFGSSTSGGAATGEITEGLPFIDTPTNVENTYFNGETVVDVAVTVVGSLFITDMGSVYVAGENNYGQQGLGDSGPENVFYPTKIPNQTFTGTFLGAGGFHHTLIVEDGRTVYAIGSNDTGQLGIEDGTVVYHTPTTVFTAKDTIAPVITVVSDKTTEFEVGADAPDWKEYFTVEDAADGEIAVTDDMIDSSKVNMETAGSFEVTITVSDEATNEATTSVTITVVAPDTTKPVITVVDGKTTEFEVGATAPDWKEYFTVSDDVDGTITVTDSMIDSSAVDMTTAGSYTVTITVSDAAENEATQTINITVVAAGTTDGDTTDPVITVVSDKATEFEVGATTPDWKEYFTVSDDVDGTITVTDEMINSTVDMTTAGSYTVTITVSDEAENEATKTINITVVAASTTDGDTTDPEITVVSDKATEFEVGATTPDWKEYFTVSDNVDGTITVTDSMINSTVDMTKAGSYKVTITVSDVAGNEATKTINIKVADEDSTNYTPLYIVGGVLWGLALLAGGYIVYKKAYKKG